MQKRNDPRICAVMPSVFWRCSVVCGVLAIALSSFATEPNHDLRVVIIRHGEKPLKGENLTCQGENRARKLPAVIHRKVGVPDFTYVPALTTGESTLHSRMFQTVTPLAIRDNLKINSTFAGSAHGQVVESIHGKSGTVLMVWNHTNIPKLAKQFGVASPPHWSDEDFDSIWIITYSGGIADLTIDREGISPEIACAE